jgi:hypothetical protein
VIAGSQVPLVRRLFAYCFASAIIRQRGSIHAGVGSALRE